MTVPRKKKFSNEEYLNLYRKELCDVEAAKKLGVHPSTVRRRRKKLGLEPNLKGRKKFTDEKFKELYDEGLNDREIAEKLGVSQTAVLCRRQDLGLEPHGKKKKWTKKKVIERLQALSEKIGRSPVASDDQKLSQAAEKTFGSWNAAKKAAGLETFEVGDVVREGFSSRAIDCARELLENVCETLNFPVFVQKDALQFFLSHGYLRGYSIKELAAASLYIACRKHKPVVGADRIAQAVNESFEKSSDVRRESIIFTGRRILKDLNLESLSPCPLTDLIVDCGSNLELSEVTFNRAKTFAKITKEKINTSGRSRRSIAAAIVYLACVRGDDEKSQRDIADVCNVTETTVGNNYRWLTKSL